jgi:tRNA pseudouridine55 synthase
MDGILIIAKEPGHTSHDVVALVRRLTGTKRVGHGGTLDPFAAGVLPVFVGLATRLVEYHMGDDKAYRATVCFGATSETDDRDGELVWTGIPAPTREAVEAALGEFRGPILQRPPAFSALKVGGRRAYQLARQGIAPDLAPRSVAIRRLDLVEWDDSDPERPLAVLDVVCGAGTYVRSLARDLGEKLGCGAYLGALTRVASGPFELAAARSLDEVRNAAAEGRAALAALMLPIDAGLDALATAVLAPAEVEAVAKGQQVKPEQRPEVAPGARIRLVTAEGALVGIASWKGGRIVPEKVFVSPPGAPAVDRGAERPRRTAEPPLRQVRPGKRLVVVPGLEALRPDMGRLYVAVGVFDGLHRGHQYLLGELRHAAEWAGARPAVVTFDAHPEELIEGLAPPLICDPDERLVRLQAAGVEVAIVQHFDHALRMTTYRDFVGMIRARVDLAGFAMTPDAAFGYERQGTPETLAELGADEGFGVTVVPSFLWNGEQVRSSEIRRRVAAGDLEGARILLGRSLSLTGLIPAASETSDGRPPVSFELPVQLPPDGRYAVVVGPSWSVERRPIPAAQPAVAVVSSGAVVLEAEGSLPAGRARVVWQRAFEETTGSE